MNRFAISLLSMTTVIACTAPFAPSDDAGERPSTDASVLISFDAGGLDPADSGVGAIIITGQLVGGPGAWPGAIAGVDYVSGSISGQTSSTGEFRFERGQSVVFSVSDVELGSLAPNADAGVTPWQLAGSSCARSTQLDKVLVLLFSLDADADSTNGVQLTVPTATGVTRSLSGLSLAEVNATVGHLISGRVALTPEVALERFIRQVDAETWVQLSTVDAFSGAIALRRGQGLATDGTSWFFSGTTSLERTDFAFNTLESNDVAIPLPLLLAGSDHIGDIDVVGGLLYAPIEDGRKSYANPKVVTYTASSLSPQSTYAISKTLQTEGVPWLAIAAVRGEAYLAEWSRTTQLNIYTASSMTFARSQPLVLAPGMVVDRIQGAKVFESALYLATDDATKSVFKVDLETGITMRLFGIDTMGEQEGLAFLPRPDGGAMHTLNVNEARNGSELRHHERTRPSLRSQLCH